MFLPPGRVDGRLSGQPCFARRACALGATPALAGRREYGAFVREAQAFLPATYARADATSRSVRRANNRSSHAFALSIGVRNRYAG